MQFHLVNYRLGCFIKMKKMKHTFRFDFDTDKDGSPDFMDCRPFNPKLQHIRPNKLMRDEIGSLPIYVSDKQGYSYPLLSKEAKQYAPRARQEVLSTIKKKPYVLDNIRDASKKKGYQFNYKPLSTHNQVLLNIREQLISEQPKLERTICGDKRISPLIPFVKRYNEALLDSYSYSKPIKQAKSRQLNSGDVRVGDKVKIIDEGKVYAAYEDFFAKHGIESQLQYFISVTYPDIRDIYTVTFIATDEVPSREKREICVIKSGRRVFLIDKSGIAKVKDKTMSAGTAYLHFGKWKYKISGKGNDRERIRARSVKINDKLMIEEGIVIATIDDNTGDWSSFSSGYHYISVKENKKDILWVQCNKSSDKAVVFSMESDGHLSAPNWILRKDAHKVFNEMLLKSFNIQIWTKTEWETPYEEI